MNHSMLSTLLGLITAFTLFTCFRASTQTPGLLSPQGCRMSYMSPSYILQSGFNASWTSLSGRYSLWLYREVGWDNNQPSGAPVLFIPGNAGSSHQVRSIASSATRQYFSSPYVISPDFSSRSPASKPLDIFAVEFNEDLSAFHGPTLLSERAYVLDAIRYILSLYPPNTPIVVLGHSMGGVVATSLLPSPDISAIITMSTPHTLPPARFDNRIEGIYSTNHGHLASDPTPIISICGGATDTMVPSESCILPRPSSSGVFRKTIFSSGMERCWTGIGHREMVWCHQTRWQVARAALELSALAPSSSTPLTRALTLDAWLRNGREAPPILDSSIPPADGTQIEVISEFETNSSSGPTLRLVDPVFRGSKVFYLRVPKAPEDEGLSGDPSSLLVYLAGGSIGPVSSFWPGSLRASIFSCSGPGELSAKRCAPLQPTALNLLPVTHPHQEFPVPGAGSDEAEGIVFFKGTIPPGSADSWVAIKVDGAGGEGWIIGGFTDDSFRVYSDASPSSLLLQPASVSLPDPSSGHAPLETEIAFPNLLANVLLVYRLTPKFISRSCKDTLLPPLLVHTTPVESHFHRIHPSTSSPYRPVLLHSHSSAPYIHTSSGKGLDLTLHTSGEPGACYPESLAISIDWWTSIGRWGYRYWPVLATWSIGVASLVVWQGLRVAVNEAGASLPTLGQALSAFIKSLLPRLILISFLVATLPLPTSAYLGLSGEPLFSLLAPILVVLSTGLVIITFWFLSLLTYLAATIATAIGRIVGGKDGEREPPMRTRRLRTTIGSIAIAFLLIFFLVPWQVAFLGSYLITFHTTVCSAPSWRRISHKSKDSSCSAHPPSPSFPPFPPSRANLHTRTDSHLSNQIHNHTLLTYFLLLKTLLLPLSAPVLAVWVRTLLTAGYTTPFDGDHNFLYVAPWLLVADWTWTCARKQGSIKIFETESVIQKVALTWAFVFIAFIAFMYGPRYTYLISNCTSIGLGIVFCACIGRRYWRIE